MLAAALLLRAAIPAGYMPAVSGSGFLFEFCPEGVPAEFVEFLTGGTGQHHTHDSSDHHDHGGHQCPVGHMLLSAAAVDHGWQSDAVPLAPFQAETGEHAYFEASQPNYRSRGPPA